MATFFLVIIYLAFISLGLPDSLLGVSWSLMQVEFKAPLETAGVLFMTIAGGTIISSFISGTVLKKFGTGMVTFVSCFMTAGALLGFHFAPSIVWLFIFAIPLGLGAGAVDTGLNNYVASHYKAHHMSWLHCFWGVGATLGPIIVAQFISRDNSWRSGYFAIASIQFILVVILLFTLPLWKKIEKVPKQVHENKIEESTSTLDEAYLENQKPWQIRGVKLALLAFLFYCGAEAAVGLWGSSFLVNVKNLSIDVAAKWVSVFYAGITIGRFITGFITLKMSNQRLIRWGQIIALVGAILLFLPFPVLFSLAGFIMIGLGLAPIFPCMLHETPLRFGQKHSQTIMGYQMAIAYTGSTFLPPILGYAAAKSTIGIFPFVIAGFIAMMLWGSERLNGVLHIREIKKDTASVS
ncbi:MULTISPECIES: MFS transporter [Niallia]|uniref:MFS transporter n=1 Tax=Niallia circulans TaxID=1397 RepID=A0A268FC53_NIACI|nr:MFS transporter [Niallia circulans]AYV67664.1 MFS transporter [Niallia circulans]AYV73993.1 MFS transporter [Niallia circulans]NRG28029.1 MFS transporter [Niallia circulans]PAD82953.1 MFS transporter [Niallia circulans]